MPRTDRKANQRCSGKRRSIVWCTWSWPSECQEDMSSRNVPNICRRGSYRCTLRIRRGVANGGTTMAKSNPQSIRRNFRDRSISCTSQGKLGSYFIGRGATIFSWASSLICTPRKPFCWKSSTLRGTQCTPLWSKRRSSPFCTPRSCCLCSSSPSQADSPDKRGCRTDQTRTSHPWQCTLTGRLCRCTDLCGKSCRGRSTSVQLRWYCFY